MSGDNLAIALFLWSLAALFFFEGRKEEGWRHWALWLLAGACVLGGFLWPKVEAYWPQGFDFVRAIAVSPVAWFVLFMAGMVLFAFAGSLKAAQVLHQGNGTAELQQYVDARLQGVQTGQEAIWEKINTETQTISAQIAALQDRAQSPESQYDIEARKSSSIADDATRALAGRLNYVVEHVRRGGKLTFPPDYTRTEGIYLNDLLNSTHLIWTEPKPKKLRREVEEAMKSVVAARGRGIGLAIPTPEIEKLQNIADELIAILKG